MNLMAKKQAKPVEKPTPTPDTGAVEVTPFRPADPRLIRQIDAYARENRRSRNMAMNLLLEFALSQKGLWPPAQ